mgnify:CR=1 FL=1
MSKNIEVVLAILKNEVDGDVSAALQKMAVDYSMTWMYKGEREMFPQSEQDAEKELEGVYLIKGRKYEIKNIAEGENVVMIELIESYPDPKTEFLHQTPLVLVLEMEDEKIKTGRHYCDPQLSYKTVSPRDLEKAYKKTFTKIVIK